MDRQQRLGALKQQGPFDVLIIGGGATGCGIAVDAASRGLKVALVEKNGIDRKAFIDMFNSFAVQTKMRRASQLAEGYGVDGVPAFGVAGRWYTAPSMTGSNPAALAMVDQLIERERKGGAK